MALLNGLPKAAMPEDRRAHHEIHTLLERAAAQQAESSLSRRRKLNTSQRTPSVCPTKDVSWYINVSTTTTTYAAPSTPAGDPTAMEGKEPAAAIIPDMADATIAARTGARAPAY